MELSELGRLCDTGEIFIPVYSAPQNQNTNNTVRAVWHTAMEKGVALGDLIGLFIRRKEERVLK